MRPKFLMLCIAASMLCATSPPASARYDVVVVEEQKQVTTELMGPCVRMEFTAMPEVELFEPYVLREPYQMTKELSPVAVVAGEGYGKVEHGTVGRALIRQELVQNSIPYNGHIDPGLRTYGNA